MYIFLTLFSHNFGPQFHLSTPIYLTIFDLYDCYQYLLHSQQYPVRFIFIPNFLFSSHCTLLHLKLFTVYIPVASVNNL